MSSLIYIAICINIHFLRSIKPKHLQYVSLFVPQLNSYSVVTFQITTKNTDFINYIYHSALQNKY